jgi:hypothetical protein
MMLELYQVGLIAISILILFIWLAARGWRKRVSSQTGVLEMPDFTDFKDEGSAGSYVATTFADRPLERVSAHGLGYPGNARVFIDKNGVQISRTGEKCFLISSSSLIGISRTSAVIDKAVEKDGLLSLRWKLGDSELESHLRFASSTARDLVANDVSALLRSGK